MAQIETWLKCDLDKMVRVVPLGGVVFSADSQANLIGVEILKDGAAAEVSGAVYGYVIRQDGATVVIEGTLDGNKASIVLPTSAYVCPGIISIVIKVGTTTVGACTGTVTRSTTDTIVDPGTVVPSISELLEQAEELAGMKAAMAGFLEQIALLIPNLAFTSASHNAAATVRAAQYAVNVLDDGPLPVYYSILKSLSNCTLSNTATVAVGGSAYTATLAPNSGYMLGTVTITMGGTDITSTAWNSGTGVISIGEVNGNITITATAVQPVTLSSIAASFNQGSATIYESTNLNDLKQYLTVTAIFSDSSTRTITSNEYTLSGTLTVGTSTITASYSGKTATFNVTVTATPTVSSIIASFNQGSATIYDSTSLNDLKQYLTVTAIFSDYSTRTLSSNEYTLDGALTVGTSTITVLYNGKTATFNVTVTATQTLSSITASFNQGSATIYDTDSLNTLKQYLTVTATYSDSSTAIISGNDYVLSGTLNVGTSTITVSYGGKTDTFSVTVTAVPPSLASISASFSPGNNTIYTSTALDDLKQYLTVTATYSDNSTSTVAAANYTLSGTLTAGTSTITVTYGGKTATFNVTVTGALPAGYTRLTYIATDGGQLIQTHVSSGDVKRAEYEIMVTALNSDDQQLGSTDQEYRKGNHILSDANTHFFPYLKGNSSGWTTEIGGKNMGNENAGSGESKLFNWNLNQRYILGGYSDDACTVDGVMKFHLAPGSASSDGLFFFNAGWRTSTTDRKFAFRGRLYWAKLYDSSGVLIHDYVPCKDSSNVVGLYDMVASNFITSFTGALIAGEVA